MAIDAADYARRQRLFDAIAKGYISNPDDTSNDYQGASDSNESLFPKRKPPPKKQTGATGPTGPPQPTPTSPQRDPFASNPAAQALRQQHLQTPGETWAETAKNQAQIISDQFNRPPQMTGYKWFKGSGGVSGGNDAGMIAHFSDGTSRWVNTSVPGQIPQSSPTTLDMQKALLKSGTDAARPVNEGGVGYGGIIPPWNSPTGKAIDTSTGAEVPFNEPTPPSGWLNRAIAASKTGADTTYNTGASTADVQAGRQYPLGAVSPGLNDTRFSTPSGGTIGVNTGAGQNDNPFTGDRANLLNAINQSKPPVPFSTTKPADQNQGGNY